MKIIREQQNYSLIDFSGQRIKLDKAAFCFFVLGMFIAAMIIYHFGLLSV
ncbi:hypothetical protein [Acinetobacter ihumii]|nr:hypothetical protein [Acinetobacter ihumii]